MLSERTFNNSRTVSILTNDGFNERLYHANCVLITDDYARNIEISAFDQLVKKLLSNNCRAIACVGRDSEELHDRIDWVIQLEMESLGMDIDALILTTWHDNEDITDVVEFFLNYLDLESGENNYWVLADECNSELITYLRNKP
jgi:hypothetical protein